MQVIQRGGNGRMALLEYDSLPERYRRAYEALHGDPHQQAVKNYFENQIVVDAAAFDFYSTYKRSNGLYLPKDNITEYTNNASILNTCGTIMAFRRGAKRGMTRRFNLTEFWTKMASDVANLNPERWRHSLPANDRRLADRYGLYVKEGYENLIHRNFCNANAAKVDDDVKESVLTELLADPRNLDNETIRGLYNVFADKMGWKKITAGTVGNYREKLELYTESGRRGETVYRNTKTMQVKRRRPACPMLYWTMDGWDVELLYQQRSENAKGHKVTTYHHRPTIVVVLDPCVNYIVGYAIGTHETPELITAALRNAANHTAELFGVRYRVNQLQTDNYSKGALTPMYEALCKHYTPARVKNAKAKVVEPFFNEMNRMCQLLPNWSGHGVTANRDNQPNDEFLNKIKKDFPDWEGVCDQVRRVVEVKRQEVRERYMELWGKMPADQKVELADETYLYWFGAETGHKNAMQPDGLTVTIAGERVTFDCFDRKFREYGYVRWTVKYDPADLTRALAVNDDGTLRFMLERKYVQPMALAERTDGDAAELARINAFNRELDAAVIERRAAATEATQHLLENNLVLDGTLAKLVLTDSRGQHKDVRNALREPVKQIPAQVVEDDEDYEVIFDERELRRNY